MFKLTFYDLKMSSKHHPRLTHGQKFSAKFQLNNLFRISVIIVVLVIMNV